MPADVEPVSSSALRASLDVRVIVGRLRRRFLAVTDADDLSPSQASVLTRIARGEVVTASALATAEHVKPQSMSVTLSQLGQMGLVTRRPDPLDGRRQLLELTAAGHERLAGVRQAREEWMAVSFQTRFTEEERQLIIAAMALLERLSD